MWVTISIYLTVVGWAYAIGSLLTLVQERSFRQALALQHFTRKVRRLGEPFLLIAGYGQTGELLARSLDALGRRFVVIDNDAGRIDDLYLDSYHADVPGLVGDAGDPGHLAVAGLGHPYCEGVLALTDNDEANLAVTQAAALLPPGPAGDRADGLAGDGGADERLRLARPWSTRSTGSATTSASPCARRRRTSC